MQRVIEFLKKNPNGFLATADGEGARVRPFGFMFEEGGKLFFCTNNTKDVYKQMVKRPNVEYAVTSPDMVTLRVAGEAVFTEDRDKKEKCVEASPLVKKLYQSADNPIFKVFSIGHGKATFSDFSGQPPRVVEF